jgi:hypothetical protein
VTLVEIVQLAQIAAPVGAAVAAVASWRSANASLRTAGRADETSRRAVEALGRATMPVLRVEIGQYPATESEAGRGPVPVTVFIVNHGSNRGLLIGAKITRPDGVALTAVEPMPMEIGSTAVEYEQHGALHLHMGTMPRAAGRRQRATDHAHVEFTDVGRVATWRHRSWWVERVRIDDDAVATYAYERDGQPEIELVVNAPSSDPPVGWVRRTWRQVW